jgi:hypothetical protein
VIDKNQLTKMYEKMRAAALPFSGSVKGRHSFGQVVLSQKGILAWAQTCAELHFCAPVSCTPVSKPLQLGGMPSHSEIDLSDELKNLLTLMALSAVEGVRHADVNGI